MRPVPGSLNTNLHFPTVRVRRDTSAAHLIAELISDIGQCVILIFYNIMQQSSDNHVLGGIILHEGGGNVQRMDDVGYG